jgi:hypothetical protein
MSRTHYNLHQHQHQYLCSFSQLRNSHFTRLRTRKALTSTDCDPPYQRDSEKSKSGQFVALISEALVDLKMATTNMDRTFELMAQTVTKLSEDYADASEKFSTTKYASSLTKIVKLNADIFKSMQNIVIMGLGSPPNLWQLAFAKFIVHSLKSLDLADEDIPMVAQDPCFQFTDRRFLEQQGVEVLQYVERTDDDRPKGYSDTEDWQFESERSEIQPAASLITNKTLLFAPNLPWVVIARVLKETNPAVYIGGSMEKLIHSNEWLAGKARKYGIEAYEEQYRSNIEAGKLFAEGHVWMRLPTFDHHWDVREGGPNDTYGDLGHFIVYKRKGDGSYEGWSDGPVPLSDFPIP